MRKCRKLSMFDQKLDQTWSFPRLLNSISQSFSPSVKFLRRAATALNAHPPQKNKKKNIIVSSCQEYCCCLKAQKREAKVKCLGLGPWLLPVARQDAGDRTVVKAMRRSCVCVSVCVWRQCMCEIRLMFNFPISNLAPGAWLSRMKTVNSPWGAQEPGKHTQTVFTRWLHTQADLHDYSHTHTHTPKMYS